MRRYAASKLRLVLLSVVMIGCFFAVKLWAQTEPQPAPATSQTPGAMGLFQLITENLDFIFFIIVTLSIIGLTLIIQGFIKNRESVLMPPAIINQIRGLIEAHRFRELLDFTERDPTFVSKALNAALKRAPDFERMKEAMETSVGVQTAEQFRKIEYLNIIGNLGPLLGLLGTTLGMIVAFAEMKAKGGSTTPADLAGGVSIALTHTFLGLFLAIPCLAAFGMLRTLVDRLTIKASLVAEELLLQIKPADARLASAGRGAPAVAAATTPPPVAEPAVRFP